MAGENIYFVSDFHLGIDAKLSSREREKLIISWLDEIRPSASELYIVGDLFDFWFEYKTVIPKGYTRILGKLAELRDEGLPIYFFTGNHDMWMFSYFEKELGIPILRQPVIREFNGKKFFIGHGDGLGPGDHGYKLIKKIFRNPICQRLFSFIHPNLGIRMARYWSTKSRQSTTEEAFLGPSGEWLIHFANQFLDSEHIDFFVFGHRHIPIDHVLENGTSRYINLGDWLVHNSFAVWDGNSLNVRFYENENGKIYS